MTKRRAVILPVVLFILLLVGLLSASFSFRVNSDLAAQRAVEMRFQTRLAAEAGIESAKLLLMDDRFNMETWYNNPDQLHRIVVWSSNGSEQEWGTNTEGFDETDKVYRFSLVADDPTDYEDFVRFGITDESSKLNLNLATEQQLMKLVSRVVGEDPEIDPLEIVNAILDWRDTDQDPRGIEGDTEGLYYQNLEKPYKVKNGKFGTVEELLMVKGVTTEILYGEDYDRNGLLTENEDDGDESFPMDDQDGALNQGLYPYLTVDSYEVDLANDNSRRVYLRGQQDTVQAGLEKVFPDDPDVIAYILGVMGGAASGEENGENAENSGTQGGGQPAGITTPAPSDRGRGRGNTGNRGDRQPRGRPDAGKGDRNKANQRRQQEPEQEEKEDENGDPTTEVGNSQDGSGDGEDGQNPDSEGENAENEDGEGEETGVVNRTPASIQTPVSLLLFAEEGSERLGLEHLSALLDFTTLRPPDTERIEGLININTAPAAVLNCIEGLTPEQVGMILQTRATLSSEEKETFAWLATEEVLDLETLERIAPSITARGQQFTIEALGYSDHENMVTRIQVVVDTLGPIVQTLYYRDISYLGVSYPIREEDLERVRGR